MASIDYGDYGAQRRMRAVRALEADKAQRVDVIVTLAKFVAQMSLVLGHPTGLEGDKDGSSFDHTIARNHLMINVKVQRSRVRLLA